MIKRRKMDLGPRCYNCDVSVYSYEICFYRNVRRAGGIDSPEIPNLYSPILTSCHQPFSLAMKRYRGDIRGVALESGDLCSSLEKRASENNNRRSNYGSG
jgi:hypothetical protein